MTKTAGKMQSMSGPSIFVGASFASFSGYPLYYGKAFVTLRRKAGETAPIRIIATCGELAPAVVEFK